MKNTIYYGPPGTGKTYLMQQILKNYIDLQIKDEDIKYSRQIGKDWLTIAMIILKNKNLLSNTEISNELNRLGIHNILSPSTILTRHGVEDDLLGGNEKPRLFIEKNGKWYVDILKFKLEETHLYEKYILNSEEKRYGFVTFHQSFVYEDFIEGIKPKISNLDDIGYEIRDGVFKEICNLAIDNPTKRYAIFIDEINRGNISEIFGELISLIELDKRIDKENQLKIILPYSKKEFGVPANLDIYGTMNSADKSIANIDIALRRRFEFIKIKSNPELLKEIYSKRGQNAEDLDGINLVRLLSKINERIELFLDENFEIGHAYFSRINDLNDIINIIITKIIPLLEEYFYNDLEKVQIVLNDLDENGDLDTNAIYKHREIDASKTIRYMNEYIDNKKIFYISNISEINIDSIRKIYM